MPRTLVIIPTYNERENIANLAEALFALGRNLDVLVVDDGTDDTAALITNLQKKYPNLFLMKRTGKQGRGTAVIAGLRFGLERGYDYLAEMDADFSHDPQEFPKLLDKATPNTVVIGSRYIKGAQIEGWPLRRRVFSKAANIFAGIVLGIGIRDYTDGYRVYPRPLIARMNFEATKSRGFIALSEIAHEMARLGANFVEVPIRFVNRKRGVSSFSLAEIKDSLWSVLRITFRPWELALLALLAATFLIGLRHALPLLGVVLDESPNVGGVLRAIQNHTILPGPGDVPYATVTFLVSYIFVALFLVLAIPFFGFHPAALKLYLFANPGELYFFTRISSALCGVLVLFFLHRLARRVGMNAVERVSLLFLILTNLIVATMFRTTKIWVLTTTLVIGSIYYLYQALETRDLSEDRRARRAVFFSIFLAFLSFANFPLNFYAPGLAGLWIFWRFRGEKGFYPLFLKSLSLGLMVFAAVTLMNWQNIYDQVSSILRAPAQSGITFSSVLSGLWPYLKVLPHLFPLLLLPLVFARSIRNRRLFWIGISFLVTYFVLISMASPWVSDKNLIFRHLTPIAFFLGLILASLEYRSARVLPIFAGISTFFYIFFLCYLLAPTTYNLAYDHASNHLNSEQTVIVNDVAKLLLPLNRESALTLQDESCATRCKEAILHDVEMEFRPLVFDARRSRPELAPHAGYYLFTVVPRSDLRLVEQFGTAAEGQQFSVDSRLGTYLDPEYFRLKNLGETIYIYQVKASDSVSP